jgi:hypothetical protein
MKVIQPAAIAVMLGLCALARADDGSVTISAPADKSKVGLTGIKLAYDVAPGPKGDHVNVYVDGEAVAQPRQLKGSYAIDKLTAGRHTLCVRVVDKSGTAVGIESCVQVDAGNVPPMGY